jgi:hypothetical protein
MNTAESQERQKANEQQEKDLYSDRVSFNILDKSQMLLEVLGFLNMYDHTYKDPPEPLIKGEKVHLISGKFPLHDYKDCSGYANHLYTFKKEDGSTFTGTLCGFTYDCTYACQQNLGIPSFDLILTKTEKVGAPASPAASYRGGLLAQAGAQQHEKGLKDGDLFYVECKSSSRH